MPRIHRRTLSCLAGLLTLALAACTAVPVRAAEPEAEARSERTFSRPHDLVLSPDGRYLYVSDVGNNRISVLDPVTLRTLGAIGTDELSSPHDVVFDAGGRMLVADSGNDRVAIYTVDGLTGRLTGELTGNLGSPEGVAVAPDGAVYVTSASRHTVTVFRGGRLVKAMGGYGSEPGRFARPHDVDVDAKGEVYVVDPGNHRIQVLSPTLEVLRILGGPGFDFNEPKYVAFTPDGGLVVADEYNNAVKIFDADRKRVRTITADGTRALNQPEGATVRGTTLWISDTYNNGILRFSLK